MKCYTAFVFAQDVKGVENLHCTHKYFGDVDEKEVDDITNTISLYFKWANPKMPTNWCFDAIDFFDESTVVLRSLAYLPFMDLRAELDRFAKDKYDYKPHVTIVKGLMKPERTIAMPTYFTPVYYRLIASGKEEGVLREWVIPLQ